MEYVLIIITSYGLHVPLEITEVFYPSMEICEERLATRDAEFKTDEKLAYTMRCEARVKDD
jgi:hypothetical protein